MAPQKRSWEYRQEGAAEAELLTVMDREKMQ